MNRTFQVWTIVGGQGTIVYRNVKSKAEAFEMDKVSFNHYSFGA